MSVKTNIDKENGHGTSTVFFLDFMYLLKFISKLVIIERIFGMMGSRT